MDAIVFIVIALVLVLMPDKSKVVLDTDAVDNSFVQEDVERTAKLNDSYYKDENAFSEMINELGFPKG